MILNKENVPCELKFWINQSYKSILLKEKYPLKNTLSFLTYLHFHATDN